jgi:hypothetical protein
MNCLLFWEPWKGLQRELHLPSSPPPQIPVQTLSILAFGFAELLSELFEPDRKAILLF